MKTITSVISKNNNIIKLGKPFVKKSIVAILIALSLFAEAQTTYKDYFTYIKDTSPIPEGTQVTSIIGTKNGYVSIGVAKGLYFLTCTGLSLNFKKEDGTLIRHNRLFNCDSIIILGGASGLMLNDSILFLNFLAQKQGFAPLKHELYLVRYNVKRGTLVSTTVIKDQIDAGGYAVTKSSTKTIRMSNGSISVLCGSHNGVNVLNFNNSIQLQFSKKVSMPPTSTTNFEFNVSASSLVETSGGHLYLSLQYDQLNLPPTVYIVSSGNALVELDANLNALYFKIYDFKGSVEFQGCTNLVYKNQNLIGSIGIVGAPYLNRNAGMYKIDPQTGNVISAKTIQALNNPILQADSNNYSPTLGVQNIQGNEYTFFCVSLNYLMQDQYLLWKVDNNLNLIGSKKSSFNKIDRIYADNYASGCLSNNGNQFILNQYSNGYGQDTVNDVGIASELFARFDSNLKSNCSKTYATSDTLYNVTNYFVADTIFSLNVNPQPLTITSSSMIIIDSVPLMHLAQRPLCGPLAPPNFTGLKENLNSNSVKISPNPASAFMRIENKLPGLTSLKMQIINSLGQIVCEENFIGLENESSEINYSVSQIPAGIYYVKLVTNKNEVYTHKLVITHP